MFLLMQPFSGKVAKRIILQVRAINYAADLQDFTVCILCDLEALGDCRENLRDIGDSVGVGAILFQDRSAGISLILL